MRDLWDLIKALAWLGWVLAARRGRDEYPRGDSCA
jgi:hypothetical protein